MKEYRTITKIAGPLVFVEKTEPIAYGELVNIVLFDGTTKRGQVLDTSDELVVVQIFETTTGIGKDSGVRFTGETIKMPVGREMLGRILSGGGKPNRPRGRYTATAHQIANIFHTMVKNHVEFDRSIWA